MCWGWLVDKCWLLTAHRLPILLLFFILLLRCMALATLQGTCKLLNLVIGDLVDEDYVVNQRASPISALIFGTTTFLSKPGQTLAPIVGTALVALWSDRHLFALDSALMGEIDTKKALSASGQEAFRDALFAILVLIPIACALVQVLAWSRFSLHGRHLKEIRTMVAHDTTKLELV